MEKDLSLFNGAFWYDEMNLDILLNYPFRMEGGFILLCIEGEAVVSVGVQKCEITRNTEMIVLPGTTFYLLNASDTFRVRILTFPKDMYDEVIKAAEDSDIVIKAAAVADYRPAVVSDNKIKKKDGDMSIELTRTEDIIGTLGKNKKKEQFLCGFSMETENMLENSKAKLDKKNLDMIVANNVKVKGAGFGTDTNVVTIITRNDCRELPIMSKEEVADEILSYIMQLKKEKH